MLERSASVFVTTGYEGTSIDDLVTALDLHRGSIYQAFGSKRGLFIAALRHHIETRFAQARPTADDLDFVLVAAVERGHRDPQVAELVRAAVDRLGPRPDRRLGARLLDRLTNEGEEV